jgi:hypothetical protein
LSDQQPGVVCGFSATFSGQSGRTGQAEWQKRSNSDIR